MVEFREDDQGIPLQKEERLYLPKPIEYKRGKPKSHDADLLQLTAQVMCLEEMLGIEIQEASLYYNEVRRREDHVITSDMRQQVISMTEEMHNYYTRRYTPKVKTGKHCANCSLRHICLPELDGRESVTTYMKRMLAD